MTQAQQHQSSLEDRGIGAGPGVGVPAATGRRAAPTGREVYFDLEDIIVSKTDLTGRIVYVNTVFLDVAGYTEDEVVGQPHSFIRNPDMPRCVFKLLWDNILSGKEVFAYVVNATKNGDHYWVFAHITPSVDAEGNITGYHSNRRCPERVQVDKVKALYRELLETERRHEKKADQVAASTQRLNEILAERGQTYEEFVFSI